MLYKILGIFLNKEKHYGGFVRQFLFFLTLYQTGIKNALLHIAPCDTSWCSVHFQLTANKKIQKKRAKCRHAKHGRKGVK